MKHELIGNVYTEKIDKKVVIGALRYNEQYNHCMFGADISGLLEVARWIASDKIHGCCLPFGHIEKPPYLCHDLQVCEAKGKRIKIGWVYTESNSQGPAYQVMLDKEMVLELWGIVWIHCHAPTEEELIERGRETHEQTDAG